MASRKLRSPGGRTTVGAGKGGLKGGPGEAAEDLEQENAKLKWLMANPQSREAGVEGQRKGAEGTEETEAEGAMVERRLLLKATAQQKNHVWNCDFISAAMHDGRRVRMLNQTDEQTRGSLLARLERRWRWAKVIEVPADVMAMKGVPKHIRSDNGPEFVARDCAPRKPFGDQLMRELQLRAQRHLSQR